MSIRHNILLAIAGFFISIAGKIESVREFKNFFATSCFIACGSHVKITCIQQFSINMPL